MSTIDEWLKDVENALIQAESCHNQLSTEMTQQERADVLHKFKSVLQEAKDNLEAFAIQIRKHPGDDQFYYMSMRKEYNEKIKKLHNFLTIQAQAQERKDLIPAENSSVNDKGNKVIENALQTQSKAIESANNTILMIHQTEQIAETAAETLANQSNQLGGMREDIRTVDTQLKRSDELIRAYLLRLMSDRIIIGFAILVVILIAVAIILWVIFGNNKNPSNEMKTLK